MGKSWSWGSFSSELFHDLPKNPELLAAHIVEAIVEIILLFIVAKFSIRVLEKVVGQSIRYAGARMDERRRNTMMSLADNLIRYTVYFVFILVVLGPILHIHIGALLAGAGIAGLALGFGAQSLIKDIITGFFILFEDQFGVGDYVQINSFTGTVLTIGLRLTRLKSATGEVQIIPNGQVLTVTNYSRYNSLAIIDMGIAVHADIDKALQVLQQVMDELKGSMEQIVGNPSILGVQTIHNSEITIRATVECLPNSQWNVQRKALQRLKEVFDLEHIELPFPQPLVPYTQNN